MIGVGREGKKSEASGFNWLVNIGGDEASTWSNKSTNMSQAAQFVKKNSPVGVKELRKISPSEQKTYGWCSMWCREWMVLRRKRLHQNRHRSRSDR